MLSLLALAAPMVVAGLGTGCFLGASIAQQRRDRATRNGSYGYHW